MNKKSLAKTPLLKTLLMAFNMTTKKLKRITYILTFKMIKVLPK